MTSDGPLAVIGVGSVGTMALWQASKLSVPAVGFEAASPAHTPAAPWAATLGCSG
ncbi:hypothetical protein [Promicromonospora soli]|uniref:Uncharacterized protein n=1 Tax=Promicromonospora soli TaxID=2035533 RepID=A0A919KMS2_9MICO|nr:hypothetical protein [Promicromonospora soli]GHH65604.1 hypothetical protein GCM10017772_04090 [Promicromonospora soli]